MKKGELKIAVFSSYDRIGGAAIFCYNTVKDFRANGYEAIELVRYKTIDDDFVFSVSNNRSKPICKRIINRVFPPKPYRDIKEDADPEYRFFGDESTFGMCTVEEIEKALPYIPNVIIVGHTFGLANTTILKQLHDKWHSNILLLCTDVSVYTGSCHVHWNCIGYTTGCKNCPALFDTSRSSEVAQIFNRKFQNIKDAKMGALYSNSWQKVELDKSLIFKDHFRFCIGQATDTVLFNPNNRNIAKQVFGIPKNSKTIMNGSTSLNDKRKGFKYFCDAMKILWEIQPSDERANVILLIIGNDQSNVTQLINDLPPFQYKCIDYITDMRLLSLAYQATDLYVGTSLEDAGPMMVSDSLSCGTPVVGFKTGLIADSDILIDGFTGYAVDIMDTVSLANRIKTIIQFSEDRFNQMSENCRNTAVAKLSKYHTLKKFQRLFDSL